MNLINIGRLLTLFFASTYLIKSGTCLVGYKDDLIYLTKKKDEIARKAAKKDLESWKLSSRKIDIDWHKLYRIPNRKELFGMLVAIQREIKENTSGIYINRLIKYICYIKKIKEDCGLSTKNEDSDLSILYGIPTFDIYHGQIDKKLLNQLKQIIGASNFDLMHIVQQYDKHFGKPSPAGRDKNLSTNKVIPKK